MNNRRNFSRESSPRKNVINLSNATGESDDHLELFDNMCNGEEELLRISDGDEELLQICDEFGSSKISNSPLYEIPTSFEDFVIADEYKNDYDWLLTPPATPRSCFLDMEAKATGFSESEDPVFLSLSPLRTSRLPNLRTEPSLKTTRWCSNSRQVTPSYGINGSKNTIKKPSVTTPKSAVSSMSSAPSSRSTIYASKMSYGNDGLRNTATFKTPVKKPKSTASSMSSIPSSSSFVSASKPSYGVNGLTNTAPWKLSATPSKSVASSRCSSPSSRSLFSASKPPTRPCIQSSKPPFQSSIPKLSQKNSAPPNTLPSRNSAMPQVNSLRVKTKPLQPSLIPGFSLEAPPNLRTTMPEMTTLGNRSRPGAPSFVQCTTEAPNVNRPRRQSCILSKTRGRDSYDSLNGDRCSLPATKVHINGILQPKETVKSMSSQESTGFGRTLSKPALDMALKHMDISNITPNIFHPHMPTMSNSSRDTVQAGATTKFRRSTIHDSSIGTSSKASSEYGASIAPDPQWSVFDDNDFGSDRRSQYNTIQFQGDGRSTNWLNSPEYEENKYGQSLFFDKIIEILSDPIYNTTKAYTGSEYYNNKLETSIDDTCITREKKIHQQEPFDWPQLYHPDMLVS